MKTNYPAVIASAALAVGLVFTGVGIAGYGFSSLLFGIGMAMLAVAQEIRDFAKRNNP